MAEDIDIEGFFHETDMKVHELSKQIPKINDVTLIVIKGHLVVERCLYEILQANMNYPKHLEQAKLTFAQQMYLVKSISKIPPHESTFSGIKKLNALRNHLAHNLPSEKTNDLIEDFINAVGVKIDGHTSQAQKVWDQIYSILGAISILISFEGLACSGVGNEQLLNVLNKIRA